MLKQKSRVYQRYPDIVGANVIPLEDVTEITEGQPKLKNQCLCRIIPIPSPLLVPVSVLMGILSLLTLVIFPVLTSVLPDVPYRYAFWIPGQAVLPIWALILASHPINFFYPYLICYYAPLAALFLFATLQSAGLINWTLIELCAPLYPMVVLVPASFFIRKHLNKLAMSP